eukprot:CAMPEP_0180511616 /NCGR_PEP_ID=MMETSP1036_2-20121128/51114_1 /TAXON_ID=632150 /ORGANISM="Azadinium spinosum, Strain 3D9" /LENGTH=83 /DNA_ID=CAMNT_0022522629 /DNA_START=42 /DNA_END=290 /DNA_ORIENTATION=+
MSKLLKTTAARGYSTYIPPDWARRVESWLTWWQQLKEPERSDYLALFVYSHFFSSMCSFVICVNVVYEGIRTNHELDNLDDGQ